MQVFCLYVFSMIIFTVTILGPWMVALFLKEKKKADKELGAQTFCDDGLAEIITLG